MIIIAGVPRSGKSTVSKQLQKRLNMSYLPCDSLISTLGKLHPQLGITHFEKAGVVSKKVASFLAELIKHIEYEEEAMILDVYQLFPYDLGRYELNRQHKVAFFGYPDIAAEEKLNDIRKHARPGDWSEELPDTDLLSIIDRYIAESNIIRAECKDMGLPFFDTGRIFDKAVSAAVDWLTRKG